LELGSGIGSGLIIAVNDFKANVTGVEISPFHYLISKIRLINRHNIEIIRGDFRNIDFSKFDVIYCYLSPKLMQTLGPKFKKELSRGARVVSLAFEIPNLKPAKTKNVNNKKIYLYGY